MDLTKQNNDEEVAPCPKEDNSDRCDQCSADHGDQGSYEVACDGDHDAMSPRKRIGLMQRWVIVIIVYRKFMRVSQIIILTLKWQLLTRCLQDMHKFNLHIYLYANES